MAQVDKIRSNADFVSRGLRCAGWLYLPKCAVRPPVVLMAHGFGAERTFGLEPFAERFAEAGLAAFLFDYRCFGDSEGEPRNWISPRRHLQDWEAALAHVKGLPAIDSSRIALWGTSFSGGHVIVIAARHPEISAIVAQVPFADGLALLASVPAKLMPRLGMAALRDLIRLLTRRAPFTVPIVGPPDSLAMMNTPGTWEGYQSILPKETSWKNACPARAVFTTSFYRPIRYAKRVRCPVLLVMAKRDELIPSWTVQKERSRLSNAQLVAFNIGHFDPYKSPCFEEAVVMEQKFLTAHLLTR
jgi:pimeloyl-ACP methyl ester carboxylesterase